MIYRALRKDPEERWQSMKDVQTELISIKQRLDSGALSAVLKPVPPSVQKEARALWAVAAPAALIICGLAGGAWWWMAHRRPAPQPVAAK